MPNSRLEIDIPLFYSTPPTAQPDAPIIPNVANRYERELVMFKQLIQTSAKADIE